MKSEKCKSYGLFDAVIVDCTDPELGISCGLYTKEFYNHVYDIMKPGAMLSQQCNTTEACLENMKQVLGTTKLTSIKIEKVPTLEYTGETAIIYLNKATD